jgi:hypothetical protein
MGEGQGRDGEDTVGTDDGKAKDVERTRWEKSGKDMKGEKTRCGRRAGKVGTERGHGGDGVKTWWGLGEGNVWTGDETKVRPTQHKRLLQKTMMTGTTKYPGDRG